MLYDLIGSGQFNMAASKQDLRISQLVNITEMKFQRLGRAAFLVVSLDSYTSETQIAVVISFLS